MDSERLIELVRKYEFLYNLNDKRYNDSQKKDVAWREIGQKLKQSDKECKKQWNALRDGFRRSQKKRKNTTNSQPSGPIKKWKCEDEMAFLLPFLRERDTNSSLNMSSSNEEGDERRYDENSIKLENTSFENIDQQIGLECDVEISVDEHVTMKKEIQTESASSVMMKYLLEDKTHKTQKLDEIETLFYSLAQTVKNLNPYYRAIAKAKVCAIVSELEIKNLTHHFSIPQNIVNSIPSPSSLLAVSNETSHNSRTFSENEDEA